MKRITTILCTAVLSLFFFFPAFSAQSYNFTYNQPGTYTLSNGIDSQCKYDYTTFTVSPGFSARNFSAMGLHEGSTCTTSGLVDFRSFLIRDPYNVNRVYYSYSQNTKTGAVAESTPLANLVLPAGSYELVVGGGAGAGVTINLTITSP